MLLTVTGCGESGPTAAQAGETLKAHITELMRQRHALDVQITDPGGRDIRCGEGRAKRTFAAVGRDPAPETGGDSLNDLLLGALSRVAPYRITEDRGDAPIWLANDEYKTTIILESPGNGRYRVRGETACLSIS
ncbi:hypothetical protein [Streptosporangium saharense]|uniref:Uncharacterized protein n=1 Tax=Streptosporangium saharense TaxID=1706840 RepID=A0A7W7VQE7_9ACTN|nr:hypothetical protein [Streptosporangium saharense]MBB4918255.1 hypothetical protein [Streptosporangium saharense]